MKISECVALKTLTTMRISGTAKFIIEVETPADIREAISFARGNKMPWFTMGGGSNIIASDNFNGVIILIKIHGFREIESNNDSATYCIGAGENWDKIVEKLVGLNLSGAECMSLIPGTVGATPVQNVGAYGTDISQILTELTAYNTETDEFEKLTNADCKFAYRNSIFKQRKNRKYIITDITIKLSKKPAEPPFYIGLENYLTEHNITEYTPQNIREAVIKIRETKLPNPESIPSAGSFFKNPILDADFAKTFLEKYPSAPNFPAPDKSVKIAAGWLIEQSGLKGFTKYGFQVYPKNALVVINTLNENSAENLEKFRNEIIAKVREKFGINLEQEPENL